MIKKMAWEAFKKTGDINTFLGNQQWETREKLMDEVDNLQKQMGIYE